MSKKSSARSREGSAEDGAVTSRPGRYHHGDLRAALLSASETELIENGIERFSLRGVAKRAGVSHAAPAHHFGDITGLLTALAAQGLDRLCNAQRDRQASAAKEPLEQLTAVGLGYIDFAIEHPAMFQLVFISERPDRSDPTYAEASQRAFADIATHIAAAFGVGDPTKDPKALELIRASWATVHGLACLIVAGRLPILTSLPKDERDAEVKAILKRVY